MLLLACLAGGSAGSVPVQAAPQRVAQSDTSVLERSGGLGGAFGAPVVADGRLYLAEGLALAVLDITGPTAPRRVSRILLPERLTLHQRVGALLLGSAAERLYLLDLTQRDAPAVRGSFGAAAPIRQLKVVGERVYLVLYDGTLQIVGIANPAAPQLLGSYASDTAVYDVAATATTLYLATESKLQIVDARDPAALVLIGSYTPPPGGSENSAGTVYSVALSGNTALIIVSCYIRIAGSAEWLYAIDLSNSSAPTLRSGVSVGVRLNRSTEIVAVSAGRAILASPLQVVDLSDLDALQVSEVSDHTYDGAAVQYPFVYAVAPDTLDVFDLADRAAPAPLWSLAAAPPSQPIALTFRDELAYVLTSTPTEPRPSSYIGVLNVIDISNRREPQLVKRLTLPTVPGASPPSSMALEGDRLYLGGYQQLHVLDLRDSRNPVVLGTFREQPDDEFGMQGGPIFGAGGRLYMASSSSGLHIFDVSDPASVRLLGQYRELVVSDVQAAGSLAYVATDSFGVVALDAANPAALSQLGSVPLAGKGRRLARSGELLLAASTTGLSVISLAEPRGSRLLGSALYGRTEEDVVAVTAAGAYAYVLTSSGLYLFDFTDPEKPALSGRYSALSNPRGLAATGPLVGVADVAQGLELLQRPLPPQLWLPTLRR